MKSSNKKPIAHYSVDVINDHFFVFWYWFPFTIAKPAPLNTIVQSLINPEPEEIIELFHKYEMVEVK